MTLAEEAPIVPRVRQLPQTCVLFALPQERKAFRLAGSTEVRVTHSGAGSANASRAASSLLAAYDSQMPAVIVCGYGGALTPAMKTGDLIVAQSIIDESDGLDYPGASLIPDERLAGMALEQKVPGFMVHKGVLVTANRVLITAHEKREWSRRCGALAVDMESAGAAAMAEKHGAPWISVRVITDDASTDLPLDFNALTDPDGNVSVSRTTIASLIRPWTVPGMLRLRKSSQLAGRNLASFLEALLRKLPLEAANTARGD